MSYINKYFRHVLGVAETVGNIDEISQGDWLSDSERIHINGKTHDGREFTLTLEIEKEVKQDAYELERAVQAGHRPSCEEERRSNVPALGELSEAPVRERR